MRADRLLSVLLLLQRRGRVTAAEVAAELEISTRTARRDLEALALAGVPVYSQSGRGGGWQLIGGARTDLSGFTTEQAQALFLAAGPSAARDPNVREALRKLTSALPGPFPDAAEMARGAQIIDPAGWGQVRDDEPPYLVELRAAVIGSRIVELSYWSPTSGRTERRIEPLGLAAKGSIWYVLAHTERGERLFRLDRIIECHLSTDTFIRPPGFDLRAAWAEVNDHVDRFRSHYIACARVDPAWLGMVRAVVGGRLTTFAPGADGWIKVEVAGRSAAEVAAMIAGFGASIVVDEPEAVRDELARIATELAATYIPDC